MNKIYAVVKKECGEYNEDGVWYSILAAFDMKENAKNIYKNMRKQHLKKLIIHHIQ